MEPLQISMKEYVLYAYILNICVAVVFALITLFLGRKKGKIQLAVWGCLAIIVGALILGFFASIPLFIIFLWLIFKKPAAVPAGEPVVKESAETTDELS